MHVCVCVCMFMGGYIFESVHMCCVCVCVCVCVCANVSVDLFEGVGACMHVCLCACIFVCVCLFSESNTGTFDTMGIFFPLMTVAAKWFPFITFSFINKYIPPYLSLLHFLVSFKM